MTSAPRRLMIAANWKMYKTLAEATDFVKQLHQRLAEDFEKMHADMPEVVLCPAFTALYTVIHEMVHLKAPFLVGAQTMDSHNDGAFTGEISPVMLGDLGVKVVIIGHSERRQSFNETDETVNLKVVTALTYNLTPIICVGESLAQREAGQTDSHVRTQVEAALRGVSPEDFPRLTFAYEPLWAIGTGKVCEAAEANRVCGLIRETIGKTGDAGRTRILYGGSVKPENSLELMEKPEIDGALVGGASLEVESFARIVRHALEAAQAVKV